MSCREGQGRGHSGSVGCYDPEYKRAKIIPPQHIIRMLWTKQLNHRVKSPQEYLQTDKNKVHTLEPQ